MSEIQLDLGAFDPGTGPLCGGNPDRNGFRQLCYRCAFADRAKSPLFCRLYGVRITARDKYALRGWKKARKPVLERDGHCCVVCGRTEELHIHHIDGDNTNDRPENLVTLCEHCHARVHTELRRDGGSLRVARVLEVARMRNADE